MPDGKPIGTLRLFARSDQKPSVNTMDFFKEWLGRRSASTPRSPRWTPTSSATSSSRANYDAFQWDWYVEPDPDSILADFTCDQRGGLSDSWYCNKEYDALYKQQNAEIDDAKRVEIVKQMQEMLFEDSPYLVTAYTTIGEAVRSDRFACFQPQPDPGGVWLVQYGAHNYTALRPADEAGDCDGVTSALKPASASSSGERGRAAATPPC